jgi:formylglycine-generating enzyme required for sulfatase activity/tRNA A-37 threonylcarbamoyl transferase component Bud32
VSQDLAHELGAALGDAYVVERTLGAGGFAVVFLVRDLALKRQLAIKVLSPDIITSHSMLERFRREAETVAQLSHPNIVPVHFIGEKGGLLWLAMQCIDGGSIADRLSRDGQLPVDDVVRITREVACALAHAHKRGIIHRDIKPPNILVDSETGRCLVTDFGIARTIDTATLTATGVMLGTPAYLSPEQITGETIDHRVDIYALGVMMYEMLAGKVPFDGATPTAAMMKRLGGPPDPVTTVRPDVPESISSVISRCLAADPAERFQSAAELVEALGGTVPSGGHTENLRVLRSPASRLPRLAAAAVLVAAVAGAGWWATARRSSITDDRVRLAGVAQAADPHLVTVPAGAYVIGSDAGSVESRPKHTTQIGAFQIERTEVTTEAYEKFVIATKAPAPWKGARPEGALPVTRVTWGDAANYCAWKYPSGGRLPTELEWEAAARGSAGRAYPYGDGVEAGATNTASAKRKGPVPVGSFPRGATPEGLQDMSGNVWEWTSSPMEAYPGGAGMPDSMRMFRVIRGGAFDTDDSNATTSIRGYLRADAGAGDLPNTGFRCVISPHV